MAIFSHERHHWAYVWIPIFTAFIWFGTLLAMIITWAATGTPHYVSQNGSIPFISDIGADILKPLFIAGCTITGVGFVLTLIVERFLRHNGRLVEFMRRRERVFASLAVLGSVIAAAGLILLSNFDTKRHPSLHRLFLLVFMIGVILSAIFSIIEFRWISQDFEGAQRLKRAYRMKAVVATILIILAFAFGGTLYGKSNKSDEAAAIFEWVIAFGFTLYLLTFWYDLHLSKGRHRGELNRDALMAQRASVGGVSAGNGNFVNGYRPSTDTYGTGTGVGVPPQVTHGNAYAHGPYGHA